MNRLIRIGTIVMAMFIVFAVKSQAQPLTDMTFNYYWDSFEQINGGIRVAGNADDNTYLVTIPFDFKYDNNWYNRMYFNANGMLTFYPYTGYYWYYSAPGIHVNRPTIHCMTRDLYVRGEMRVEVQGTAPNRVVIFQWLDVDFYYSYSANMDFQVRLYETSNIVEIIYGDMNRGSYNFGSYYYYWCKVGFSGAENAYNTTNYINIAPGEDFVAHFSDANPDPWYYNPTVRNANDFGYFQEGLTLQLTAFPTFVSTFPAEGSILERGKVYDGDDHPSCFFERIDGQAEVYVRYKISGPLPKTNPNYQVIYTATAEGNPEDDLHYFQDQPVGMPGRGKITHAKGIAARTSPENDGALDLETFEDDIPGGEYLIEAEMVLPDHGYTQKLPDQTFVIALDNDIAITRVNSPRGKEAKKYPYGTGLVPLEIRCTNIGLNPVRAFDAVCEVYDMDGDIVHRDSTRWIATNNWLTTGESKEIDFRAFRPMEIGDYETKFAIYLVDSLDDDTRNNFYPRTGYDDLIFNVAYEIEAAADDILAPEGEIYVGRPVRPYAQFSNQGVSDISDVDATVEIKDENGNVVFTDNIIIQDIPSGRHNTTRVKFDQNFIPESAGEYTVKATVASPDDPLTDNNSVTETFTVVDAMAGRFTIGMTNAGNARNYETIQDAVDDLYQKGVTGPVIFELTDENYEVGSAMLGINAPALDLTSMIIGVNETNTIKFVPSRIRATRRGGITIKLNSSNGMGIKFGQDFVPGNSNAAVHGVTRGLVPEYARSTGYISFDGGEKQAFEFLLNTASEFRAPFYLGEGSQNIEIKNSIIGNFDTENVSMACSAPLMMFDRSLSRFVYQDDLRDDGATYSAGVVVRNTPPTDKETGNNTLNLDTTASHNIIIEGNEISGFGYGIVSLGLGVLYETGASKYTRYYNHNNIINNNTIHNVSRAGILVGFEENSEIKGNRIYEVTGSCGDEVAGIIAGGEKRGGFSAYNNIGLEIDGNEISDLRSSTAIYGVKVQHAEHEFAEGSRNVFFPDVDESIQVKNNVIWGITPQSEYAVRFGIRVYTQRDQTQTNINELLTPVRPEYFSKNDKIVNNTIIINSDGEIADMAPAAAVAVQQTDGAVIKNNAIAFEDDLIHEDNEIVTAIFYHGTKVGKGVHSDRNAFQLSEAATVYRYILTDEESGIIEAGKEDEFTTLSQWRTWTGADMNSIVGNFTDDLAYSADIPSNLRVIDNPPPLGSILNNRGDRLEYVETDIDGNVRGLAGQRYDIGAFEFLGRMYVSDLELIDISEPAAYKSNDGMFSDAEYIMTHAPIDVVARIRNNGSLSLAGVNANVAIYTEGPDGEFEEDPYIDENVNINISPGETIDVSFNLADKQNTDFYPQTYADLASTHTVPAQFSAMQANVTPKYKIAITLASDEQNRNNTMEKVTRFYIHRSSLGILLSVENSSADIDSDDITTDRMAGRLNYDSLLTGINRLGWIVDVDDERYDVDIFDRKFWEPKSVDYTMYRTLLWADGDDKALTRYEMIDLSDFLADGSPEDKRNLIIGSQEIVRDNYEEFPEFINDRLRAEYAAPGNPLGVGVSNDANQVMGVNVLRNITEDIAATGVEGDADPYCGLMGINEEGAGLSRVGFKYVNTAKGTEDSTAAIATSSIFETIVLLGVDWRHWNGDLEEIIRGSFDYIEKNGGVIVPIELLAFEAHQRGRSVELNWTTASEINSSRFEIERAETDAKAVGIFSKIDERPAAGESGYERHYGPVTDHDVEYGNTYIYRLKMIDKDGQFDYSEQKTVTITGAEGEAWIESISPNPATSNATLIYGLSAKMDITVEIYDLAGRKVAAPFSGAANSGENRLPLGIADLPNGVYTILLSAGDVRVSAQFTVAR